MWFVMLRRWCITSLGGDGVQTNLVLLQSEKERVREDKLRPHELTRSVDPANWNALARHFRCLRSFTPR